ncbi:MAG: squalene/phytoene synthase family protein [Paracoccaceae bacterium]
MSTQACAKIVRLGDPDRFLATMAAPLSMRPAMFAIYAFNVEVSRAPWLTREPMIAEMRLQWWRDALEEIGKGGLVRRHEVATPLAQVLDHEGAAILDKLVRARKWDCYQEPFENARQFRSYIEATGGGLMWAAARAVGVNTGENSIRNVGAAAGLANWLRAVPELTARGRTPLVDPRPQAISALAHAALEKLRNARKSVPGDARPVTRSGWQAGRILHSAAANPATVAGGRLHSSEFTKKLTLMMRVVTGAP